MGGNNTKPIPGSNQYERFGLVGVQQITDQQSGETISMMNFSRRIQSQKFLNAWNQQISRIQDSQSRDILLLPQKHVFEKAGLCGSNGLVYLTYQNFPYVLDSEIKNRKKLDRYFTQTQMWYLLYNIIRAGNKFQKIGKKVGDVNPHNVVINDDGQIKVISTCSIPNQQNNFQKIIEDKNAKVYLAPQQLNDDYINKCEYPPNIDPCKAQVFSIGLTILSSAILQDCFEIYIMGTRKMNQNLLNRYIDTLRQIYSPYLSSVIMSMLNLQPKLRKKSSQIYNQLYPHQMKILDLQQFFNPQQVVQGSRYVQQPIQSQVVPTPLRQSINQPPSYLNQPNHPQNSGFYPSPVNGYPVQQRVVYQENVQPLYKY